MIKTIQKKEIKKYRNRISGPIYDRIDLCVEASEMTYQELQAKQKGESSADIRERVKRARHIQQERYAMEKVHCNGELSAKMVEKYCVIGSKEQELIQQIFTKMHFSARSYHRLLKVARTIADLAESEEIKANHIAEAIQFRSLDRKYFS